jgi:hypothetical protein
MRYIIITGFLLNVYLTFPEPTNRNERRQMAATGMFRRS